MRFNRKKLLQIYVYTVGISIISFLLLMFGSLIFDEFNTFTKVMEIIDPFLPILMGVLPTVFIFLAREDDYIAAQSIVDEIKNEYEPIVSDVITVNFTKIEDVYYDCMTWLQEKNAHIFENNFPEYILAFEAGRYSFNTESDDSGIPKNVMNWPKFFQFKLNQDGVNVNVIFDIHQGWKKIMIESYEKRKKHYPKIIQDLRRYLIWHE